MDREELKELDMDLFDLCSEDYISRHIHWEVHPTYPSTHENGSLDMIRRGLDIIVH